MSIRAERKIQNRQNIIDKVLLLRYQGQPFYNISLRQVAQEVGLAPSAIYRYFPNKDTLAQATVDQVGVFIKSGLFQSRARFLTHTEEDTEVRLAMFFKSVEEHALYWHFFVSERWGGYPVLERSIEQDVEDLANDLVLDLKRLEYYRVCEENALRTYAELLLQLSMVWSKQWIKLHKIDTHMIEDKVIFLRACFNKVVFLKRAFVT
ncbi:TetR family transcriptional regulator [Acinetobacter sp. B5B]|uniref:TetR/AcrR family transcriptional regulator n=1 Tax=Acinetobacter baretiae TaxID=2605383 RepID=UPI0018C27FED|nr:TetR/AcrR family transcriptional regulator [Acinetobacter baretiae]MBF7683405.1 TetR family transcriptional regulator [Acinetobacter baretiae]MBF7685772.1 TetR family transcriptional regulator [Acinetobacter baretiae]